MRARLKDFAEFNEVELLFLDPEAFDEAIIGLASRADGLLVVAYDYMTCLEVVMRDGMGREDAEEYFEFNVIGAWSGDGTPVFVDRRYAE